MDLTNFMQLIRNKALRVMGGQSIDNRDGLTVTLLYLGSTLDLGRLDPGQK